MAVKSGAISVNSGEMSNQRGHNTFNKATEVREPLSSAILLVPGSLFSDVNGDYPTWSSFPHVYAHLAHQLSALGHAVYRFAKLGPGTGSAK